MDLFKAVILGIVEGITEFLPVSSTGHLILAAKLLKFSQTDFMKTFEIAIQLGAILSVVVLYWKRFLLDPAALKKVLAAFIPTAVLGLVFYKVIKSFLLSSDAIVLWALFLGGIFLVVFELLYKESQAAADAISAISYPKALLIGVFQSIAMVPGVSRAAATICGGLFLGLKRRTIVEFSFLLAVPTMLAATLLDLFKSANSFSGEQFAFLAVGFIVSFFVAMAAIKFLLYFIKHNNFIPFGIYRMLIALVFWFMR